MSSKVQEPVGWQKIAHQKRQAVLQLIPTAWTLPIDLPPAEEQRDVTGHIIESFLTSQEIIFTQADAVEVTRRTSWGEWKARDVVEAFCHRAALAHQMVGRNNLSSQLHTNLN